jgi:hypothetical protein
MVRTREFAILACSLQSFSESYVGLTTAAVGEPLKPNPATEHDPVPFVHLQSSQTLYLSCPYALTENNTMKV